jgi:O-antigen ligase
VRPLFDLIAGLFQDYAVGAAYGGLVESLTTSWFGHGTGTNTGSARYALERPEFFRAIENYYAKAAYELGALGLLLLVAVFVALLVLGSRILRRLRDPGLHASAAALLAFLIVAMLYSFKTWLLDLDPVNVYFWLFAGVLTCLPALDRLSEDASAPTAAAEEAQ